MDYLHDLSGKVVADWESRTGYVGWATGYVYLSSGLLAQYQGSTTHFAHLDHLGSTRLLTDLNRNVVQNLDYLPFGELNSSDSGINSHKFTGDERDSETNLDHTWFRQYSSQLGRWMHPDPAGLAAVDPSNPQSWNRYSYVKNDPVDYLDPFGEDYCPQNGGNCIYMLDGVYVSADYFNSQLQGGFAVLCQTNNCSQLVAQIGPGGTTIWQQWRPWLDGVVLGSQGNVLEGSYVNVHWHWVTTSVTSDSNWWGDFAATFFGGLVSADGWKAVYHSTVDEGGCDRLMFETFANDMSPLPMEENPGIGEAIEVAPKAVAALGWARAQGYSVVRGLGSHAMQSGTFRGLRYSTMSKAATVEEAAPYVLLGYATVDGVGKAAIGAYRGTCH